MPLTQKRRHNPLMLGYVGQTGRKSKPLAKLFGVSHSQMYMARERNVGPKNAEKISRGMASLLGLSQIEELRLKAEIMGHPEDLLRAYLRGAEGASEALGEDYGALSQVLDPNRSIPHKLGTRVAARLEEMNAPPFLIEDVRGRAAPKYSPPGRVTFRRSGADVARERKETREGLAKNKPITHQAIRRSGMSLRDLYESAGVGRETLRKALYERCGAKTARKVAKVLRDATGLSEGEKKAVEKELKTAP